MQSRFRAVKKQTHVMPCSLLNSRLYPNEPLSLIYRCCGMVIYITFLFILLFVTVVSLLRLSVFSARVVFRLYTTISILVAVFDFSCVRHAPFSTYGILTSFTFLPSLELRILISWTQILRRFLFPLPAHFHIDNVYLYIFLSFV